MEADWLIEDSLRIIEKHHGKISIHNLARQLGCSTRTLEKQFRRFVGLPTKYFAQVKRIHHAMAEAQRNEECSWHDMVYSGGLYDQSHFIKVFRQVMHCAPSEFFDLKHPVQDHFVGKS